VAVQAPDIDRGGSIDLDWITIHDRDIESNPQLAQPGIRNSDTGLF